METNIQLSPQQQDFVDFVRIGSGSGILEAVAGAGKTSTILAAIQESRGQCAILAYNKDIAVEIQEKLEKLQIDWKKCQSGTVHSFGFKAYKKQFPSVQVMQRDENKTLALLEQAIKNDKVPSDFKTFAPIFQNLISLAKQRAIGVLTLIDNEDAWMDIVQHFDLLAEDESGEAERNIRQIIYYSMYLLRESNSMTDFIDFDDMCYLPLVHKCPFWQYHNVFVDECFTADAPILTSLNGDWMTIGQIVESGYLGPIVSWDEKLGTVIKNVTGHKKVLRNKPMKQIKFVRKYPNLGLLTRKVRYGMPIVACTEDHLIKTANGWTEAKNLRPGDTVFVETAQQRVPEYQDRHKISKQGKHKLSEIHLGNVKGIGNSGGISENLQGGNGKGPTKHEAILLDKLNVVGLSGVCNYVVPTKMGRGSGFPTCYKIDVAIPEYMIAIEVDGASHNPSMDRDDSKKDSLLTEKGWTVFRVTNKELEKLTPNEIRAAIMPACFVEAEIVEVNDYDCRDTYVYDLEVDGTNCYFVHGLLVHNCQDTNPARRAMVRAIVRKGGRVFAVGDRHQAIYGFTGADYDSLDQIANDFNAQYFPLTTTFRCPKKVVEFSQQWVNHIEAHESAPEGVVSTSTWNQFINRKDLDSESAVLCRNTKPLVQTAFALIRAKIGCRIEGREIGAGLEKLATRWSKVKTVNALEKRLDIHLDEQRTKLLAKKKGQQLQNLEDQVETLLVIIDECREKKLDKVDDVVAHIKRLFSGMEKGVITLATIHKSKGKEWPRVFWLDRAGTCPSKWARQQWELGQEANICYVAATRAKNELVELEPNPNWQKRKHRAVQENEEQEGII